MKNLQRVSCRPRVGENKTTASLFLCSFFSVLAAGWGGGCDGKLTAPSRDGPAEWGSGLPDGPGLDRRSEQRDANRSDVARLVPSDARRFDKARPDVERPLPPDRGILDQQSPSPGCSPTSTVPSGYTLLWAEEFNGSTTTWPNIFETCWEPWIHTEASKKNFSINNGAGHLKLSAPGVACGKNYTGTGIGDTAAMYDQTAGYWETRARLTTAGDKGITGYILLWPKTGWPPEIDFFETTGNGGDAKKVQFTQHWGVESGSGHPTASSTVSLDVTQYHTYGVEVTSTNVRWYVDGVLKADQPNHSFGTLWHPGAGIWACGWGEQCANLPPLPQYMDIDYMCVYKK